MFAKGSGCVQFIKWAGRSSAFLVLLSGADAQGEPAKDPAQPASGVRDPPRRSPPAPRKLYPASPPARRTRAQPTTHQARAKKNPPWFEGVSASYRARAQRLFKRGNLYFAQTVYSMAMVYYDAAIKYWDHPLIRFNMAVCNLYQQQLVEAYRNVKKALRYGKAPLKNYYQEAVGYYSDLSGRLATIVVTCDDPGARVSLDGRRLFVAPGRARQVVTAGDHLVVATKGRGTTVVRNVFSRPGKTVTVKVAFRGLVEAVGGQANLRERYRYGWALPTAVMAVAATMFGLGVGVFVEGQRIVRNMNSTIAEHQTLYGSSTPYVYDPGIGKLGRRLQITGYALLGVAGAVVAAGVVLWVLRKRPVRRELASRWSWYRKPLAFAF